jgi:hypothetical protein
MEQLKSKLTDLLDADNFAMKNSSSDNKLYGLLVEDGSVITVLDRLTGFDGGRRDIESGYRDLDGKFWLASGGVDIREQGDITITEAIQIIKERANTCIGVKH